MLSIVKRRDSLGLLQHSDTEERFTKSSEELHALLQIAMGGMVAEEHWFDEVSTGPASDLAAATSIGAQMIGACGMGTSLISVAAAGNGFLEGGLVDKVLGDTTARAELDTLLMAGCDAAKAIVTPTRRWSRRCVTRCSSTTSSWALRSPRWSSPPSTPPSPQGSPSCALRGRPEAAPDRRGHASIRRRTDRRTGIVPASEDPQHSRPRRPGGWRHGPPSPRLRGPW